MESNSMTPAEKDKNTGMAVFAYFIFFLPLLTDAKDDPFVKFHVKQSLVFFVTILIAGVIEGIIGKMPLLGGYLIWVVNFGLIVIWILGILNAIGGKEEKLLLIGKYADKFNL